MSVQSIVLHAESRAERGKEKAKKTRRAGRLPAVIYGAHSEPTAISLDAHEFMLVRKRVHGDQVLIKVEVNDGSVDNVFIKDLQREPVTDTIIHADLLRVNMSEVIQIPVKIVAVGSTPAGVKLGGMLETHLHEIAVRALPGKIPAHIEVDLSNLGGDESIHVSELPTFDGVEYLNDGADVVFTIISKERAAKREEAADAAAAASAAPVAEVAAAEAPAEE